MASGDGPKPSKETLARLRGVQRRLNDIYGTESSDAENARLAKLLADIVEAKALSVESKLHLRPIFSTNFRATVGADTSKAT